eukprot:2540648-Pyramimonas_sp.AAC.2
MVMKIARVSSCPPSSHPPPPVPPPSVPHESSSRLFLLVHFPRPLSASVTSPSSCYAYAVNIHS